MKLFRNIFMLLAVLGLGVSCVNDGLSDDSGKEAAGSMNTLDEQAAVMKQSVKDIQTLEGDFSDAQDAIGRHISYIESGVSMEEGSLATLSLQKSLAAVFGEAELTGDASLETIHAGIASWLGSELDQFYPLALAQAKTDAVSLSVERQKVYAQALSSDIESGLKKDENPSELASLVNSVDENEEAAEKLSSELSNVISDVETAYQQAIKDPSYDSASLKKVNRAAAAQTKAADDSYAGLVARVAACETLLQSIVERLGELENEVEDLKELLGLVQSLTFVSEYASDKAVAYYDLDLANRTNDNVAKRNPVSSITLDYIVRPASAAVALTDETLWNNGLNVFAYYAQAITKAPKMYDLEVENVSVSSSAYGIVSVTVKNSLEEAFYYKKTGAKLALSVTTGKTDLTSQFVEIVPKDASDVVYIESLVLSEDNLDMNDGASRQLNVTVSPGNVTNREVVWTTSNNEVVEVSGSGMLVAKGVGSAVVTATSKSTDEWGNTLSASCNVKVSPNIKLVGPGYVEQGGTIEIKVESPDYIDPSLITWSSSHSSFASVDENGVVTGLSKYYDTDKKEYIPIYINCSIYGGQISLQHTLRIVVPQPKLIKVSGLTDNENTTSVKIGSTLSLASTLYPVAAQQEGYFRCYYQSGYMDVATVDFNSGLVSAKAAGTATVTITATSSTSGRYEYPSGSELKRYVNVVVEPYWVTSLSLPQTMKLAPEAVATLTPVFTSDVDGVPPTNRNLTWSSSNPSIVSVDATTGEMTAHGEGTVTITARTVIGAAAGSAIKSATCVVTVKAPVAEIKVGDYYYSDGTWSTDKKAGKTVIGVVFSTANAVASDPLLLKNYPNCTNGLVVSTKEYSEVLGYISTSNTPKDVAVYGGDILNVDAINGYTNTSTLGDYSQAKGYLDSYSVYYAQLYRKDSNGVAYKHNSAVSVPSSASPWYVPSYKELTYLSENIDAVNSSLANVGDTISKTGYWLSSFKRYDKLEEIDVPCLFDMSTGTWGASMNGKYTTAAPVRVVLAF